MEDASLDRFLDDPPERADDSRSDEALPSAPAPDAAEETTDQAAAVDPATATMTYVAEGAPCAACGARVERRWRGEDGLRCVECKAW